MITEDPYRSPVPVATPGGGRGRLGLLIAATCVLLLVGGLFLLLLNGQEFTNTLVFLVSCGISTLLWATLLFSRTYRRLGVWVVLVHVVLMAAFLPGLPGKRQRQANFNARMQELRLPPALRNAPP